MSIMYLKCYLIPSDLPLVQDKIYLFSFGNQKCLRNRWLGISINYFYLGWVESHQVDPKDLWHLAR